MSRQHNEVGGGAQSTANGLSLESQVSLSRLIPLWNNCFSVHGHDLIYQYSEGQPLCVAKLYSKDDFWNDYFEPLFPNLFTIDSLIPPYHRVVISSIWSKMLYPDEVLVLDTSSGPIFLIIEVKTQGKGGSVDEKLQTCDYKISQYSRLLNAAFGQDNYTLEFAFLLDNWFAQKCNSFVCVDQNMNKTIIRVPRYRDTFNYIHEADTWYFFPQMSIQETQNGKEALQAFINNVLQCSNAWPTTPYNLHLFQSQ